MLFGAVSISSRYNHVSRELIVRFFQAREKNHELEPHQSSPPLPAGLDAYRRLARRAPTQGIWTTSPDPISDLETDSKGVPILMKQYAKLGGRLVSFNVDRNFSSVLDGLVLVDLRQTDPCCIGPLHGQGRHCRLSGGIIGLRSFASVPVLVCRFRRRSMKRQRRVENLESHQRAHPVSAASLPGRQGRSLQSARLH